MISLRALQSRSLVDKEPERGRLSYVLITPARNEEAFIEQTIASVLKQTILPKRWVIVSDGSTDGTEGLVGRYSQSNSWIHLLRMPQRPERHFGGKAACFNAGYKQLGELDFDLIGNLDADITFERDYMEFLLDAFAAAPSLGVAGTPYAEDHKNPHNHTYSHQYAQLEHVSGACQLFRRACFEEVGGYLPIKGGAVDWVAVTTARMMGWKTQTFLGKVCHHHRPLGTGTDGSLMVRFRYGEKAYAVGGHPFWEFSRAVFQFRQKPLILGSLFFLAGYLWALASRRERSISKDLIAFHRTEQMMRLRQVLFRRRPGKSPLDAPLSAL
jgi:biofilm PGA synthesis N-glycosyltransferase PgaC